MSKKMNLKEYFSDDTLDLSMLALEDVPVKEVVAISKATNLVLSSNKLTKLPVTFTTSLTRLVKLDLSSNQLTALPDDFGELVNLRHLDLFKNRLQTLPLSFCRLRALRWLDVKGNPLVPKMAQVAGPCLDSPGCQYAARNVVKFLTSMNELQQEAEENKKKEELAEKMKIEQAQAQKIKEPPTKAKKKKKKAPKPIIVQKAETVNGGAPAPVIELPEVQVKTRSPPVVQENPSFILSFKQKIFHLLKHMALLLCIVIVIFAIIVVLNDKTSYNRVKSVAGYIYGSLPSVKLPRSYKNTFNRYSDYALFCVRTVCSSLKTVVEVGAKSYVEFIWYFMETETYKSYDSIWRKVLPIFYRPEEKKWM